MPGFSTFRYHWHLTGWFQFRTLIPGWINYMYDRWSLNFLQIWNVRSNIFETLNNATTFQVNFRNPKNNKDHGCPVVESTAPDRRVSRLAWRKTDMYANGTWCMQNPSWVQRPSHLNYTSGGTKAREPPLRGG